MRGSRAIQRMQSRLEACAERPTGPVPLAERLSWTAKEAAARAHLAGEAGAADTALLEAEARETGETLDRLAATIVRNADVFRAASARLAGLRRHHLRRIAAAETPAEVAARLADLEAALDAG